ncbi:MAG: ABC transporter ATP-binding protein, partial [Kiritimatiellia bacterium]
MTGTVAVSHVSKTYRLYRTLGDRLREALHPRRRKYHRTFYALDDVSCLVEPGETLGIIGRNGSGKSTLLKIIAGIITPCRGSVCANGRISALLELGAGFNPELTGLENIYFSGTIMGISRRDMRARLPEITSFADIGPHLNQPVKTYSSGMFVRLAFAVAINVDPDVLIVDEALAVGDINFQARCFRRIDALRQAGRTVIFVTHALDSILRYCNKALVLDQGRKVVEADPKTAVDAYKQLMAEHDHRRTGRMAPATTAKPQPMAPAVFTRNPDTLTYGNEQAVITDCGMYNETDQPTLLFSHGETLAIRMTVSFKSALSNPIFAFTIKDLKGLE